MSYANDPSRLGPAEREAALARMRDEIFDVQGMVKLLGFYDPDGNPWMFAETSQTYPGQQ